MATIDLGRYQLGWSDEEDYVYKPTKGLSETVIRDMSAMKKEPEWMLEFRLRAYRKFLAKLVPPMLEKAEAAAALRAQASIAAAVTEARETLDAELARLHALRAVNPSISEAEITSVEHERTALLSVLPQARLRLDAVRFVVSPDFLALR